jgi:hypothetical protein
MNTDESMRLDAVNRMDRRDSVRLLQIAKTDPSAAVRAAASARARLKILVDAAVKCTELFEPFTTLYVPLHNGGAKEWWEAEFDTRRVCFLGDGEHYVCLCDDGSFAVSSETREPGTDYGWRRSTLVSTDVPWRDDTARFERALDLKLIAHSAHPEPLAALALAAERGVQVRKAAIEHLTDRAVLAQIAQSETDPSIRQAAAERLDKLAN